MLGLPDAAARRCHAPGDGERLLRRADRLGRRWQVTAP